MNSCIGDGLLDLRPTLFRRDNEIIDHGKAVRHLNGNGFGLLHKALPEVTKLAGLSPEERYEKQPELEKLALGILFAWAETRQATPKSTLGKALHYLKKQRCYLLAYPKR